MESLVQEARPAYGWAIAEVLAYAALVSSLLLAVLAPRRSDVPEER